MGTTHDRLVSVPGSTLPSRSSGDPADPALILLMGNTMPGGFWPPEFCAGLAATGLYVTEYDYRDVGGSTLGAFARRPYDLLDLADDVCAVADALGRERVHLAGLSMGGFLALLTALRHPERVASVTSMMSTADYTVLLDATLHGREPRNPTFPPPRADWAAAVSAVPVDQPFPSLLATAFRLAGGSRGDGDEAYWLAEIARVTDSPETTLAFDHKLAADRTDPAWLDLVPRLGELTVPVQVIQGADDPIFPPPTGRLTAEAVPHATLLTVDGMGHMLEPAFFAPLTEALSAHVARAAHQEHDDAVRAQFRLQAATFTDHGWATSGLGWIVEQLDPGPADVVADIAAGAAHLGRALAPHVAHVSALDLTPAVLERGQELARADGLRNVVFLVGDAVALPWLDGQFDLVVCRLTLHQVADPAAVVREMVRITRPGGRVGIIDMVADDDPAVAAETDRLERLRDPSHGRTLTLDEQHALLTSARAVVVSTATRDNVLDFEDWMERTGTPPGTREDLRARLAVELDGGPTTGLRPSRRPDGTVVFTHRWACTIATA